MYISMQCFPVRLIINCIRELSIEPDSTSVTVNTAKAVMSFRNLPADGRVLAKVGISSVDEEGARLNVEAEIPQLGL